MKLSRLISNGMIIHKDKPVKIWGTAAAGSDISAVISKEGDMGSANKASCTAGADGSFALVIDTPAPGDGYRIIVTESVNGSRMDEVTVSDVAVGLTYIMCGQSNAGFPMCRVRDTYPEEWDDPNDDRIRTFKIEEHYEFKAPVEDVLTGSWKAVTGQSIDPWCAVGYFAAKKIADKTGLFVGIIDATQGGSPIEAWMSRQWLADFPDRLEIVDKYSDDDFVASVEKDNATQGTKWRDKLNADDAGLKEHWERSDAEPDEGKFTADGYRPVTLPAFLWETEIGHLNGSIWLKKVFDVEDDTLISEDSHLWLGTMTDADITYVNGTEVGRTEYSYPPRRYDIPAGLLKKGRNEITIRLSVEHGMGRITPHKLLAIFTGDTVRYIDDKDDEHIRWRDGKDHPFIDLSGRWYYKIAAKADEIPGFDFLCWKPTALYNGVLAPCLNYPIGAFLWYQGESNTGYSCREYYDLTLKQAEGIRAAADDPALPYIYARLPRYDLNCYEGSSEYYDKDLNEDEYVAMKKSGWAYIQEVQEKLDGLPGMYMTKSTGLGEGFDLHPQDKKPMGEGYADVILGLMQG